MGWSIGFDSRWNRDIGYGVPAYCDHPDCDEVIDRGLSYVCGGEPYGGENGCGLYFCGKHIYCNGTPQCERCVTDDGTRSDKEPFKAKPDHPDWVQVGPSGERLRNLADELGFESGADKHA